jgi:hypothetical protein
MTKPTPEQLKQIEAIVQKSWLDSVDSITTDELNALADDLKNNPKAIRAIQHQLMAIAYVCFQHNEPEFSNVLKRAGFILAAFRVKAEQETKRKDN